MEIDKNRASVLPDSHAQVALELIQVIRSDFGDEGLNQVIDSRSAKMEQVYLSRLAACEDNLQSRITGLAQLRSEEAYMAEVRLLPDGWLLIENHCPICAAAEQCQQFCRAELKLFENVFAGSARVERVDHLLAGARRCAYKISPVNAP